MRVLITERLRYSGGELSTSCATPCNDILRREPNYIAIQSRCDAALIESRLT